MGAELGDDRDPLLVRPFVLPDGARQEPVPSMSTWPAQPNTGEQPTQLLPAVPAKPSEAPENDGSQRGRSLILAGAGVAAIACFAVYGLLRTDPPVGEWVSQPGLSLPAAIGPSIAASDTDDENLVDGQPDENYGEIDSGSGSSTVTGNKSPTPAAGNGTGSQSAPASPTTGVNPSASVTSGPPAGVLPSAIPTGQGLLVNGSGLCLDLRGGRAAQGRDVHVDTCNGTSPQRWRLNSDRTLVVLNMCAYMDGDSTVELTRCYYGRDTATWQLYDNGTLINLANGQCLTDPNSGTRTSTAVTVAVCTGGKNQSWTFG